MSEKGMIFTADSVIAILAGNKSQTRRVVKCRGKDRKENSIPAAADFIGIKCGKYTFETENNIYSIKLEHKIDDIIYVKETWNKFSNFDADELKYYHQVEDCYTENGLEYHINTVPMKWRSPMYMPKAAARIWLKIMGVRVERLQDISESDALAEGLNGVEAYKTHWGEINGKRDKGVYAWDMNPFVWVIEFERDSHEKDN